LDIISNNTPVKAFEDLDFDRIEPYTLILFTEKKLYSCKWDGTSKWVESLNSFAPRIWSSVTLYGPDTILKREKWFDDWITENPDPSAKDIIRFHLKGGDGDPANDLYMNRGNSLFTNSISCIRHSKESAAFRYMDLRSGITADSFLSFQKKIPVKA
jgi:hypothetical protein